jgi:hypothetical protein
LTLFSALVKQLRYGVTGFGFTRTGGKFEHFLLVEGVREPDGLGRRLGFGRRL